MNREEALYALMEAANAAITGNPDVRRAIERLDSLGLQVLQLRLSADVQTKGERFERESDDAFLASLRIVPDLKVSAS